MKIIDRYVTGQVLLTGLFAVGVLSVVLVLGNVFKQLLELLVNHDAPLYAILSFIAYIIPFSLTFTIPWGFLTAVLLVFGKMSAENELIALRSSGVSVPRVSALVFVLAAICVGICLWINLWVAPHAQVKMKNALYQIATDNPMAIFGDDKVIDQFPGRRIYVEKSVGQELQNLLIYELDEENNPIKITSAKTGLLSSRTEEGKKVLLLELSGARHEWRDDPDKPEYRQGTTAEQFPLMIPLEELYEKNKKKKGMSSLTVQELLSRLDEAEEPPADAKDKKQSSRVNTLTELNKRFSFSLASLAFALIGVPLAITAHRKETTVGFMISMIVAFVYFCFILLADAMRSKPKAHPELLVWLPNVLFIGLGLWLFYRLSKR